MSLRSYYDAATDLYSTPGVNRSTCAGIHADQRNKDI